jgi:hypothetical protein
MQEALSAGDFHFFCLSQKFQPVPSNHLISGWQDAGPVTVPEFPPMSLVPAINFSTLS